MSKNISKTVKIFKEAAVVNMSSEEHLKQVMDGQALLLQITQRIARGGSLSVMLPDVSHAILKGTRASGIRIVIGDPSMPLTYSSGLLAGKMVKFDALITSSLNGKEMLNVEDVAQQSDHAKDGSDGSDAALRDTLKGAIGAFMAVPLKAQQLQRGMMWIAYETPHTLTDAEQIFLSIAAGQTAVAVANDAAFNAARRGREQLAAILTSSVDPILVVNNQNDLLLLNPAAEKAFGVRVDQAIGKPFAQVIDAEPLIDLFEGKLDSIDGVEWQNAEGQTFAPRVSDISNEDNERTGRVLVLRDITRYKVLREKQSVFVSTITHDLRAPLTYMHGYATMLPMIGELNEKQRGFADKIIAGIMQMSDLVEKILDAGRLDPEGNFVLSREACDLTKMVAEVVAAHVQPAERTGLTLTADIDPNLPILNLDEIMLRRAVNNLVDNAVKYTPSGGKVSVSAHIHDNAVWLRVTDTGLGISIENQKKLFDMFIRVRRREHITVKGTGLGLFIVKGIAQRHGGDAWVESEEGKGSTFTISIPLEGANLLGAESRSEAKN